jgi:hypothetical protein
MCWIKSNVFRDATSCSFIGTYRRFRGTCYLHLRGILKRHQVPTKRWSFLPGCTTSRPETTILHKQAFETSNRRYKHYFRKKPNCWQLYCIHPSVWKALGKRTKEWQNILEETWLQHQPSPNAGAALQMDHDLFLANPCQFIRQLTYHWRYTVYVADTEKSLCNSRHLTLQNKHYKFYSFSIVHLYAAVYDSHNKNLLFP